MNNKQRKILILGGNIAQVPLIRAAKKEGYYVVLVDFTSTNPGIALADKHYHVNFMDREKVLEIAKQEHVEGVISNSEAAMSVVAYISEKCNFVGNTMDSILKIVSKINFRILQKEIGMFAPAHIVTTSFQEAIQRVKELEFPVIMKPCKSSGSRGTTKIETLNDIHNYINEWEMCSAYSMDKCVVLEEFVELPELNSIIEGDIFVFEGTIFWDGLFTTTRSAKAPLIPMTAIFPIVLEEEKLLQVKDMVTQLLQAAGITFGEYNIEMYYDQKGRLFCIEINARQGGDGIPDIIQLHCGIDMHKLLVTTAMGDKEYFEEIKNRDKQYKYISRQVVFCHEEGIFEGIYIDPRIEKYVVDVRLLREKGTVLKNCETAEDSVALVDLLFEKREQQLQFIDDIEKYIFPSIRNHRRSI